MLTDSELLAANNLEPPAAVRLLEDFVDEVPLTVREGRDVLSEWLE